MPVRFQIFKVVQSARRIARAHRRGLFLNELIAALELSRLARLNVNAGSRLHDVKALLEPAYRTYDATQEEFDFAFMKNYVEGPNARYNHLSALEMFDRLHDLSCFFIDNLDMSDAVLACKAMLLLAGYSTDIPFWYLHLYSFLNIRQS